jgi:hypothetical protein
MTPSGTRYLLRNRLYLGELREGEHVNLTAVEPLVSTAMFEAAQMPGTRPPRSVEDGPALLAGLIRCAGCGHVMSRKRTARLVYSCAGLHSGGRCPEPAGITTELADRHVEALALEQLARLSVADSEGDAVQRAQATLADAEDELAAFLRVTSFRDAGFEGALGERRGAVDAARATLRALMARQPALPAPEFGTDAYYSLGPEGRNRLLRGLIAEVVVTRSGRGRRVPVADRVRVVWFGQHVDRPDA